MNQTAEQLSSAPASNAKLVGIGGWLLLLIVKLWAGVAVRVLAGISEQSHAVASLNFGFAAFAAIAAYLLGRKHPKGVILAKILLAAEAVYYILELLLPAGSINTFKTTGFLVASVLYFIYLFRSERVKNTYFGALGQYGPSISTMNSVDIGREADRQMTKGRAKAGAIAVFLIALLLWVATIIHNTLGFVAPISAEAVGFDLWSAAMWLLFLYASRKLYRAFWKNSGTTNQ